jgi:hypothetical protein
MKKTVIIALLVLTFGCSDSHVDTFENYLSGYYKVVAIDSDTSVDMNNDGLKSRNLFEEISGPYSTPNGERLSFYNFSSPPNYMEVRPLKNTVNDGKLITVNFPHQYIDQLTNGDFFLMTYLNTFMYYSYEFTENRKQIKLINNNPSYIKDGVLNSLELYPNGELELKLTKPVFDFVDRQWIEVRITAFYQKVEYP